MPKMPKPPPPDPDVVEELAAFFNRNGYMWLPNYDRREEEPRTYKKGYEVRLVANSLAELQTIRRLLAEAGFSLARPFAHIAQWRQPLYGRKAVVRFLTLIGRSTDDLPDAGGASAQ